MSTTTVSKGRSRDSTTTDTSDGSRTPAARVRATGGNVGNRLGRAAQSSLQRISENPVAAAAGAAAISAGLAFLLPSGRRETEMMGELADKLSDVARDAADSAVELGRSEVEALAQSALVGVGGAVVEAIVSTERPDLNSDRRL
jgi:hypothetical protein